MMGVWIPQASFFLELFVVIKIADSTLKEDIESVRTLKKRKRSF